MTEGEHLQQSVLQVARKDFATLRENLTIQEALDAIRQRGVGEKIIYFYVVNSDGRLAGVLPTRRLLLAPLQQRVSDAMVSRVVAIPHTSSILEACEAFVLHKFLAFPVVDEEKKILGVVDVGLLSEEAFDIAEDQTSDDLFERIGFRVSQVREASSLRAFRFRFPWLLATIGSGTICALLASFYAQTLEKSIVLTFFLTLVLGLAESVSIQSMTVTIQALHAVQPTMTWYFRALRREAGTALLLGVGCGAVVGLIVWLWRGAAIAGISIGSSILLALCAACFFGLSVPALLHALKLDPKIAAGPVTLAFTDSFTLLFYFSLAALLL
jgi:magnesium transporter